jgi:hypothetical protein
VVLPEIGSVELEKTSKNDQKFHDIFCIEKWFLKILQIFKIFLLNDKLLKVKTINKGT